MIVLQDICFVWYQVEVHIYKIFYCKPILEACDIKPAMSHYQFIQWIWHRSNSMDIMYSLLYLEMQIYPKKIGRIG